MEFTKIAKSGIKNGQLFYNLGNTYLKQENLGQAVLWYERALTLIPRDPDLQFNLKYACGLVKDKSEEHTSPLIKSLFFWNYILSFSEIIWLSIGFSICFWLMAALRLVFAKRLRSLFSNIIYYTLMNISAVLILTSFNNYYQFTYAKQAIILPEKISIRSGLSDDSTELFVLHAGSKIKIQSEKNDYVKIYFSDGKLGWIRRSSIGIIHA
ncbi:MAG: hypothetical protein HF978_13290 [Desulfobacteraceae bacterium]|nr:hypothetical protein [Desulfobacteraceae bacterium]MBC2756516.1 hypothetical protein [Desulfobacteraceae bacterium]